MSLTLKAEQKLRSIDLVDFYAAHRNEFRDMADRAYLYVRDNFPLGSVVRQEDVVTALFPNLEVDPQLVAYLQDKNKTAKYWTEYFAAYIVDNQWIHLTRQRP